MSRRPFRGLRRLRRRARISSACKSCSPDNIPAKAKIIARFAEAEPIPGPTSEALAAAAKLHGIVIVGSVFERRAPGLYHNTAIVLDADGSHAGMYRKMHIPDDPHYYEKFYFTPGDLGFRSVPTRFGPLGPLVCWDQWYPEAARLVALAGGGSCFIRRPSVGSPARKPSSARANMPPGKP